MLRRSLNGQSVDTSMKNYVDQDERPSLRDLRTRDLSTTAKNVTDIDVQENGSGQQRLRSRLERYR